MNKICAFVIAAVLLFAGKVFSQDIHFSQFYASPLTLNPALTGKMTGDYRLAAIYRSQWKSITGGAPAYSTPGASFDIPFVFGKNLNNAVGAGVQFVYDMTNDGRLNTLHLLASVAYHRALDKNFNHQISLGFQGGIQQLSIKTNDFTFGDQFDQNGSPTLTTQESFSGDSKTNPAFNAGFFYSGRIVKKLTLFAGYSLFNLGEPDEVITNNGLTQSPRYMRHVVHGGLDWRAGKTISILPGVIFMTQAKAQEVNFGSNIGIDVSQKPGAEATLFLGAWYRWDDAVIPMAALELMKRLRVGFSYDVTTSSVADFNENRGGFEISLIYIGKIVRVREANLFCPRF
ncbi:MAG: hypothetical protein KatS3mg031_1663 [Chitinophagales bacterium]|nr:MAG: hypothetical protein KatS3mg031_1663 [Chitinophagales bacterium]